MRPVIWSCFPLSLFAPSEPQYFYRPGNQHWWEGTASSYHVKLHAGGRHYHIKCHRCVWHLTLCIVIYRCLLYELHNSLRKHELKTICMELFVHQTGAYLCYAKHRQLGVDAEQKADSETLRQDFIISRKQRFIENLLFHFWSFRGLGCLAQTSFSHFWGVIIENNSCAFNWTLWFCGLTLYNRQFTSVQSPAVVIFVCWGTTTHFAWSARSRQMRQHPASWDDSVQDLWQKMTSLWS